MQMAEIVLKCVAQYLHMITNVIVVVVVVLRFRR